VEARADHHPKPPRAARGSSLSIHDDPETAVALAAKANADLAEALEDLRELARGIHPSALAHGLAVALESLAAQSVVSTGVTVDLADRLPEPIQVAASLSLRKHWRTSTSTRGRRG
jgi:signal transduction histidine kinase